MFNDSTRNMLANMGVGLRVDRPAAALAAAEGVSVAELIRRAVDTLTLAAGEVAPEERRRRAAAVAGRFASGRTDVSSQHDRHLAEAFSR